MGGLESRREASPIAAGRKRTALGWVLAGFATEAVLSVWQGPLVHTGWGWAAGASHGIAWAERDWVAVESDEWSLETHPQWVEDPSWMLPSPPAASRAAGATVVDLWIVRYSRFNPGFGTVWSVEVLLWPLAAAALGLSVPLLVSGRRIRHRVRSGRCPACAYSLAGLGPGVSCPECGKRGAAKGGG